MQSENKNLFEKIRSEFITFPNEELILIKRKHWITFGVPLLISSLISVIIFALSIFVILQFPNYWMLTVLTLLLFFVIFATANLRSFIDWYLSFYVVSNKKITEVRYRPLSSKQINKIMLDQVRCTEIDTRIDGMANEFLDIGDVIITFDRPTHQEEFLFNNIHNPKQVETQIHKILSNNTHLEPNFNGISFYSRDKKNNKKWKYFEEMPLATINMKGGEKSWN